MAFFNGEYWRKLRVVGFLAVSDQHLRPHSTAKANIEHPTCLPKLKASAMQEARRASTSDPKAYDSSTSGALRLNDPTAASCRSPISAASGIGSPLRVSLLTRV